MKRALLITLGILALFTLIVLGLWQKTNYTATQEGKQTLSFREFIGLGTNATGNSRLEGYLSSAFTSKTQNDATTDTNSSTASVDNANSGYNPYNNNASFFDSVKFTPNGFTNLAPGNLNTGKASNPNGPENPDIIDNTTQDSNSTSVVEDTTPQNPLDTQNIECTDADMALDFTPEETAKLADLRSQLQSLNGMLYSVDDLSNQNQNYASLSLLFAKFNEENNYCWAQIARVTSDARTAVQQEDQPDPKLLRNHLPTPYWHDPRYDTKSFLDSTPPGDNSFSLFPDATTINSKFSIAGDDKDDPKTAGSISPDTMSLDPNAPSSQYYDLIESLYRLHIW